MKPLPLETSDAELIGVADRWAQLMEAEDYEAAFSYTEHTKNSNWTPALMKWVVENYGDAEPGQKVTFLGQPTDITQQKRVYRHDPNRFGYIGEILYDLNISGFASDLTASLHLQSTPAGIVVFLNDIHVM